MAYKLEIEEEEEEDDDTTWIDKLSEAENLYNDFYKEEVLSITIYVLYVNKNNEVAHTQRERCLLQEKNVLSRDTIFSFIKRYQKKGEIKYKLLSLLRYNIGLDPTEINDFLTEDIASDMNLGRFITSEKYLNDIHYEDTIHMFQDLNALYFIFYEERDKTNKDHDGEHNQSHTRRIILTTKKLKLSKTRRNTHKENKKNLKITKE